VINPGLPASPISPASSQSNFASGGSTDLSNGGTLVLHIQGYTTAGTDYDSFPSDTLTLGGTSNLILDLDGLGANGSISPISWTTSLTGVFSDAPNAGGANILPSADVINNPYGFQATLTYNANNITITLSYPSQAPLVAESHYGTTFNTQLSVNT